MIIGIGIDSVHISRMRTWRDKPGLLERYFHPAELTEARNRGSAVDHSLAARFAAKEAFGKALGTGLANITLRDICVENDKNGKPSVRVYGTAANRLLEGGGTKVFVSLTHENDNAIAVVVIEGAT